MYKRILEFWMNERELKDLQKITPEFRDEANRYLEDLGKIENGIPSGLRSAEAGRVKQMLGEISAIRREKMFRTKTLEAPQEFLRDEEFSVSVPLEEPERAKDDGAKKILVRLLRDVASFVGADLKTYGPFKSEDVVLLPAQNADALIKRGSAAEIQRKA